MFILMGSCTSLQGGACFLCETVHVLRMQCWFKGLRNPWPLPLIQMLRAYPPVISCFLVRKKNPKHICIPRFSQPDAYHANQSWSYNLEAHCSNCVTHWGPPGSLFGCGLTCCFYICKMIIAWYLDKKKNYIIFVLHALLQTMKYSVLLTVTGSGIAFIK